MLNTCVGELVTDWYGLRKSLKQRAVQWIILVSPKQRKTSDLTQKIAVRVTTLIELEETSRS